jgi:hypothetical protein
MRLLRFKSVPCMAAVLVALLALHLSPYARASKEENPDLTRLLAAANDEAIELASDADETQLLVVSDANWLSHAILLAKVKAHVDNMASIIDKLSKAQKSGSMLQEKAANQMLSLVKELSANTTAAINYLNQNKTRPTSETHTEYLKRNAQAAHQLSSMISSLLDYVLSMKEIEDLKSKLETTSD